MQKKKLTILYEDKELLVLDKPAKVLTVGTDKEKMRTLFYEASMYVKKQHPKNKIFIVHRLDRDTSGIVVFAKKEPFKHFLQEHWDECASLREYYAVVEGRVSPKRGRLVSYLKENSQFHVYSTTDKKLGKKAITNYEVIQQTNHYSLLKIQIETGRKNQIRVQLKDIGHPIIGDKKYGATKNPIGRLGLVAQCLKLRIYGKEYVFETKIPKEFLNIFDCK